ncbi:hypothetical protein SAMN05444413_10597 [Roseivivax marinus]|uniref:hypothetical protein n=1 Tax=Roseivivax marinus TaxID=1379903 RepID=UPI0008B5DCD5|nr:hypothetical protein [Roseivivax marinus]SEL02950.1 hypothetical protein SAMN05444413_10597 [Roseivivax marinus]
METFLQPPWPVVALFFVQRVAVFPLLFLTGLARAAVCRGPARGLAVVATLLAALGVAVMLAPAISQQDAAWFREAARAARWGGGWAWPAIVALVIAIAGRLPGGRGRWIDALLAAGALALALLFALARLA